ncbi:hypothetical protein P153DRAFT_368585 [Dothidotthia symphoricarpi CBS 119687]|uniref:Uncharacterized protein n=1 Tax=Dothidotthia symphoricarpi CBS 119687 TaxID=1392245 RepID=A0A6A6A5L9_9PLEO|nr:uncharacterized protein P153DRAFT_368585 [Dothidotthia symphoricarpi CBS 119687]KAF2127272.1 hypothetical protein P153DRAFT_368585 [Dothidotthia symphoricarpi CBS 119687]
MDSSRARSRSSTRRSYPNLHNLSLAPLSSKYPLDASTPPSPNAATAHTPRTSYIAQKSAPTTPGILSLSQSRSNSRHRATKFAYDGYFVSSGREVRGDGEIPKAKSTNTLHAGVSFADQVEDSGEKKHHTRKHTAPLPLRAPLVRHHTTEANDEWFHRAGLAIAGETRESKGQGWLVRRESSTSLVQDDDEHHSHDARHMALLSGEHMTDFDFPTFSPRMSRVGSRITSRMGSRAPSARQSRRGSRVGSRADLLMSSLPASGRQSLDISDLDSSLIEPDFVSADEDNLDDEEEVARLARDRGFGLGSWVDKLIGWSLFDVDEDEEASEDEEEDHRVPSIADMTKEELKLRREVEAKRRKMEREAIAAASAQSLQEKTDEAGRPSTVDVPAQELNGWQDAAWLLSVASKALF